MNGNQINIQVCTRKRDKYADFPGSDCIPLLKLADDSMKMTIRFADNV